ncbi:MAG: chorismate-binding protein [Williamsia sp.]|nr:chorismate-binding protein [Williamsia sp.]
MRTLLIDNYDSYTYIIAQYLWLINGSRPIILKNNALSIESLKDLYFDNIVISPGPGTPENEKDVELSLKVFKAFPDTPILGICLGHQCLGKAFGGRVVGAPKEMHGKYSQVNLQPSPLFDTLPPVISVVRYHSLLVAKDTLPACLSVIGETNDGEQLIMALQHVSKPFYGVQFHPESIGTEFGEQIIRNFKNLTEQWMKDTSKRTSDGKRTLFSKQIIWTDAEHVFDVCFKHLPCSFWLDSSLTGYNGRFSFMGAPESIIQKHAGKVQLKRFVEESELPATESLHTDFFDAIQEQLDKEQLIDPGSHGFPFKGGFVGYLSYEAVNSPSRRPASYSNLPPESLFLWVENFVAFDLLKKQVFLCSIAENEQARNHWFARTKEMILSTPPAAKLHLYTYPEPAQTEELPLEASRKKNEYIRDILQIKQYLKAGETYETCLTNEFKINIDVDAYELYRVLRQTNPAPYSTYFRFAGFHILSSSPECFIKITKEGNIRSEPIKGTRAKGVNRDETEQIKKLLKKSAKDHSELLMIIDLIRNDLSVFCDKASVRVTDFMKVTEYATLLQLSSVIEGRLAAGITVIDVLKSIFPGGSITGAPKRRTMEIIEKFEQRPRGIYTGSIGYISIDKAAEFNIAIRTMVVNNSNEISFGSGGAILAESDPEEEYRETLVKAYALIRAVYLAKFRAFEHYRIAESRDAAEKKEYSEGMQQCFTRLPDLERIFKSNQFALLDQHTPA